jgi:hypothetical protein
MSGQFLTKNPFVLSLFTGNLTLTNATQADQFFAGSNSYIYKMDLQNYTQGRIVGRVSTASSSANSPKLKLGYHTAFSTTVGDYSALGTALEFSIFTGVSYGDSGWVDLASGSKISNVFVALLATGGDGDKDPVVGNICVQFR